MDAITILGLAAAFVTTVSLLPQLISLLKPNPPKTSQPVMFTLFCAGVLLWFIYGLYTNHLPIILANCFAFIQAIIILAYKIKYK